MTVRISASQRSHAVIDSPIGPLTLIAADGRLAGRPHGGGQVRAGRGGARRSGRLRRRPGARGGGQPAARLLQRRADQLRPAAGPGRARDSSAPSGTGLQAIPYGETISYGELARRIGQPSASRAVGLANGRNPVSIVVPCHRVIGADGSLTGYGGGMDRKRFLLGLEQRVSGQTLI